MSPANRRCRQRIERPDVEVIDPNTQDGRAASTLAILRHQRALGCHTIHLTGERQGGSGGKQQVDGWHFFRTRPLGSWWARLPALRHLAMITSLTRRLRQVALRERPDVLHAHSPALNAVAALRVGRALGIPVLYEIRAFWKDAAADHGTSPTGGLRYRLTRALNHYVLRQVDAGTTICEGLRNGLIARGVPADQVTVIPNAVNVAQFDGARTSGGMLAHDLGLTGHLVLGFIGAFYAYEGLNLLIAALPKMLDSVPSLQLLLTWWTCHASIRGSAAILVAHYGEGVHDNASAISVLDARAFGDVGALDQAHARVDVGGRCCDRSKNAPPVS